METLPSGSPKTVARRPRRSWIREEHEEIAYHIRTLERLITAPDRLANKAWAADLVSWFRVAAPRIEHHLRHEESRSFYRGFDEKFPRFVHRLEHLIAEHRTMIEMLRRGRAAAESPTPKLLLELTELIALAHKHEREENEIVGDAVLDDLGTGD